MALRTREAERAAADLTGGMMDCRPFENRPWLMHPCFDWETKNEWMRLFPEMQAKFLAHRDSETCRRNCEQRLSGNRSLRPAPAANQVKDEPATASYEPGLGDLMLAFMVPLAV